MTTRCLTAFIFLASLLVPSIAFTQPNYLLHAHVFDSGIWHAECSATYRFPATAMYNIRGGAQWDLPTHSVMACPSGPCFAGTMPAAALYGLTFYAPLAKLIDKTSSSVAWFVYQMDVYEYANSSCTGSLTFLGADPGYWASPIGVAHQFCWTDGALACGAPTDPGTCHMPDVQIHKTGGSGLQHKCYNVRSYLRQCFNSPTSNCTSWNFNATDVKVDWL
jgi:hypothetical protein